jgi:hypothetical protein
MVKDSEQFRENAENCLNLAEGAANEQSRIRYRRMAQSWFTLATEQDWLDGYPVKAERSGGLAGTERAGELAEATLDGLSDKDASFADVEARKSRLIDGPAEFRNVRVDND